MPRRSLFFRFFAIQALLAVGVLIPLHLAHEHHDEAAPDHEGEGHDEGDHGSLTLVRTQPAATPPLSFASTIWVLAASSVDVVPALATIPGTDRAGDLPPPGRVIAAPTPPRAPPATLS